MFYNISNMLEIYLLENRKEGQGFCWPVVHFAKYDLSEVVKNKGRAILV